MATATRTLNAEFIGNTKEFQASMMRARDATVRVAKAQADLKLQSVQTEKAELAAAAATDKYGAASIQAREATARLAGAQARTAVTARNVEKGMAAASTTTIAFRGHTAAVGKAAEGAESRVARLGKAGEVTAHQLKHAGELFLGATGLGIFESLKAAKVGEASQAKLRAQLRASGISYRAHSEAIEGTISAEAKLAAVTDHDLKDAFTNILRVTGNVAKTQHLVGLAADISRGKHIALAKAGELVGKVAGGNTGILTRYGIAFTPVKTAQNALTDSGKHFTTGQKAQAKAIDKTASAHAGLALLQKKFAGQAEAYGKTSAGAVDRAKASFEHLAEEVGLAVAPTIGKAANATAKFVDGMRKGTGEGGKFVHALRPVAHTLGSISHFLHEHPKLIRDAVAAWGAYKVASLVALTAIKLGTIRKVFARFIPVATTEGAAAGAAYATSFDATAAAGTAAAGTGGKLKTAMMGLGRALGPIAGAVIAGEIINDTFNNLTPEQWSKGAKGNLQSQIGNIVNGSGPITSPVADAILGAPLKLKSPALPTGPVKTPRAPNVGASATPSLNDILSGGTTSGGGGGESAKQKASDAAQKRKDAAERARQAAEDARQLRLSMIDALAAFRSAGTNNPLTQNRIQQRADRQKLALATSPLERLQDRTDLRGLKRDAQGLRVQGKQDDIQFALDMGRITNDVAANQYKHLAKMVHGNKALRRQLLVAARQLRQQDSGDSGSFDLNNGDVSVTAYEVHRDRTARLSAATRVVMSTASQPTTVHNGPVTININGANKSKEEIAQEVADYFRKKQRTHGAAVRRAQARVKA